MKKNSKKFDSHVYAHLGKLIEEASGERYFSKGSGKSGNGNRERFRTDTQTEAIRLSQLQCKHFNRDTLRCDFYRYDYTPIQCPFCPAKVMRDTQS